MKAIEGIRLLLCHLPKSDQPLGGQFVQSRDFESLKDLVDSAIYRVKRGFKKDNPREEYLEVDLKGLYGLKNNVDDYVKQLRVPSWDKIESYYEKY